MEHLELLQQDNNITKCVIHSIYDSKISMNRGNPALEKIIQSNIERKQQRRGREQSKLKSKLTLLSLVKSCKIIEELPKIQDLSSTLVADVSFSNRLEEVIVRKRTISENAESMDLDLSHPKKSRKNLVIVKPPEVIKSIPAIAKKELPKIISTVAKVLAPESHAKAKTGFRIPSSSNWNRQVSALGNLSIEKKSSKVEIPNSDEEDENDWHGTSKNDFPKAFITAKDKLAIDAAAKYGTAIPQCNERPAGKRLGARKGFVSPLNGVGKSNSNNTDSISTSKIHDSLKNFDPQLIERIEQEIMVNQQKVDFDEIAGLEHAKKCINEAVVWPLQNPKLFTGIRAPPKGLLLFGPPGTGKTLIGKCIASSVDATFFSISSSALTSKWVGEGEKLVKTLFAVARAHQPSVIFIDEVDSLLSQRSDGEQDGTRRMKTEFLVQFDGCGTDKEDRILLIGATNRPQEIDDAAQRRFRKKLYIPLPEAHGREKIVNIQLSKNLNSLTKEQVADVVERTEGYSGSDMANLISEAAMGPLRDLMDKDMRFVKDDDVRPISHQDFLSALTQVRPSVSQKDLEGYLHYEKAHGSLK